MTASGQIEPSPRCWTTSQLRRKRPSGQPLAGGSSRPNPTIGQVAWRRSGHRKAAARVSQKTSLALNRSGVLLDDLVGTDEDRFRDSQAELLGGLEIDDE